MGIRSATACPPRHRGAVAVLSLVMLVVLLGFASLTLDVGALYSTRADLQNGADAAAMAGASAYTLPEMMSLRMGKVTDSHEVFQHAVARAQATGLNNRSFAAGGTDIPAEDVELGWINLESATAEIDTGGSPDKFNAVGVITKRSTDSANGPVNFYFAPIFGKHSSNVSASAVAAFDDRFSGYDVSIPDTAPLWPFTIEEKDYAQGLIAGSDLYSHDEENGVQAIADGISEVQLYPYELAPGEYGLLNVGTPNHGVGPLSEQILYGIPSGQLLIETGYPHLSFYDDAGLPRTYQITGNPGLKSSLQSSIETRIGDIVGIFLHDSVSGSGAGAVYRITGIRFARVMSVHLQGSSKDDGIWLQPVSYTGPGVKITPGAPSSNGAAGRIVLVR